ncbi:hypothetical protein Bbelb_285470 [Branchiostoma belcheri]|nr:hypothetical protein Bbelb_285470 [Branchiostoma belcheri]
MAEGGHTDLLAKKSTKATPNRYEEQPPSGRYTQVSPACPTCGQQVKVTGVSGSPVSGVLHVGTPTDGLDTGQNYRSVGKRYQRECIHQTYRQQVGHTGERSTPGTGENVAASENKHRYCALPGKTGSLPLTLPCGTDCGENVGGEGAACAHNIHTCGTPEDDKQGEAKTPQNNASEMTESILKKLTSLEESRRVAKVEKTEVETQILKLKEEAIRSVEESANTLMEQVCLIFDRWEEDVKNEVEDLTSSLQSCHGNRRHNYVGTKSQLDVKLQRHAPKPPRVELVPNSFEGTDFSLGQIQVKKLEEDKSRPQDVVSTPSRTFTSWKSRFGTSGTKRGQFLEPLCVTAALGHVYVIDRAGGGRVQVFTLKGEQVGEFSLDVGNNLSINGCGLSSDGRCVSFVGSLYEGTLGVNTTYKNVFAKYTKEGRVVTRRTLDVGSNRDPVIDAAGFADGRMAVALTGKVCILATSGDALSEFDTAVQTYKRVCVDTRNNNILLSLHKTVQEYDERGRRLRELSLQPGPGRAPLTGPHGLCVDSSGNIIVANWSNSRVQMFDRKGGFLETIAGEEDGLVCPWDVTVPKKGYIIVANSRVQMFDRRGGFLETIAGEEDGLVCPWDVTVPKKECVTVVDWREHCVFVFRY